MSFVGDAGRLASPDSVPAATCRHADLGVEGLGLGLAIVRDCAEAIDASIKVDATPGEAETCMSQPVVTVNEDASLDEMVAVL